MKFKKTTLPNGLRVITIPIEDSPATMVMVAVETGSNYEDKSENGLSHFLEHMCFKGTLKRPKSSIISKELDGLGAENNAFTSNEVTGYYAKSSKKHFDKIFEIVSDLYLNPTLPADDLEKERGVILEEISMYEDLPHIKVWFLLSQLMYGDEPAGRSILGPRENIKRFKQKDFVNYRNKHYVAGKTLVIVAGDVSEKMVLAEVKKHFKDIPAKKKFSKKKVVDKQASPALLVHKKKTDQAHMVLAFRAYKAKDKRTPALALLTEILGKGMSSRLSTKLREEMGACYYIHANFDQYTDYGCLAISTGINVSRTEEVLKALLQECKTICSELVSEEELKKAKEHLSGHLYLGLETTDSLTTFYLNQEIVSGGLESPQEWEKAIRKVSAQDVMKVAKDIFKNEKMNLAIVGDVEDPKKLKKILSF